MIVEIVRFAHPASSTRAAIIAGAETTVERWRANGELLRKLYLLSPDQSQGLGIYTWPSIEAARRAHDAAWIAQAEQRSGGPVHIEYHELLIELDNVSGRLLRHHRHR